MELLANVQCFHRGIRVYTVQRRARGRVSATDHKVRVNPPEIRTLDQKNRERRTLVGLASLFVLGSGIQVPSELPASSHLIKKKEVVFEKPHVF